MSNIKNLCKVVINLTSNIQTGRYKIVYSTYPIKRETEKTITIIKNNLEDRILKSDLLTVTSDFTNDKSSKMQYITTCLEEDLLESFNVLSLKLYEDLKQIDTCHQHAMDAYRDGYEIQKLN